jgi:hypothetical protein
MHERGDIPLIFGRGVAEDGLDVAVHVKVLRVASPEPQHAARINNQGGKVPAARGCDIVLGEIGESSTKRATGNQN